MRKSILIFIAATLCSAIATPATTAGWDWCGIRRVQCIQPCINAFPYEDPRLLACQKSCDAIAQKCTIRQDVTIPVDGSKPKPGKLPAPVRPSHVGSGIPAGGILDSVTGMGGGQGPSATGTPLGGGRAPSAPPVIIR
jgi:hypothetical protein